MAGQSINDRITAAKYSLAGQGLAKAVCKATTEEVIGPKKKHLEYLLLCTNEANVSIPQLANLLIERTQMQSWVSVFKALITVHHLMCYGNERFTQFLASSNCNFNLGGFLDKSGTTEQPQLSYDMSTFIRRYAKYINEKAISYRSVAFDFCKTKRSKEDGTLRVMSTDTLLKTLPTLQNQLDALLDFDCTASELNNGVINCAFMLLFRDLIRLYACYSDGVINLLEKYFEMNKKQAREALDCYKKFLIRMDRVAEFLKVAENVGIDKGELPDLKKAPSTLLDALESHLASLEGKKGVTPSAASGVKLENAVSVLNSVSSSFGLACSNGRVGETANGGSGGSPPMDEITKRAALAEEEAMYEKLKQEHSKNNPFLSSPNGAGGESAAGAGAPSTTTPAVVDLFGGPQVEHSPSNQSKVSDDLLQLGNPFADILSTSGAAASPPVMGVPAGSAPSAVFGVQQSQPQMPFTNGFMQPMSFVPDRSFEAVFGANYSNNNNNNNYNVHTAYTFDGFGEILKPEGKVAAGGPPGGGAVPHSAPQLSQKLITGDLDMSLSSLVENLNMKGPNQPKNQWSSPKSQNKTGGGGWTGSAQPPGASMGGYKQPSPIASGQWGGVNPQGASGMPQMGMMGSGFPGAQSGGVGAPPGSGPAPFDPLA